MSRFIARDAPVLTPLPTPTAVNHVWAYDFVFDTCADGRSPAKPA